MSLFAQNSDWLPAQTTTHQDHVIAHVIGATPLGHFIWDETAYLLLDIGFIWNIYLDGSMGLVPHGLAITELEAEELTKRELRAAVDKFFSEPHSNPIQSVEFLETENARRLVLNCEEGEIVVETWFTDARRGAHVHPLPVIYPPITVS